jgi:hypothetical protein
VRVSRNLELFLNGRYWIVPIVVNGWTLENTTFEAITDYTLTGHIYQDCALNAAACMEASKDHNLTSSFMGKLHSYPMLTTTPIDLLPQDRVAIHRDVILKLCACSLSSATTESVLAALQGKETDRQLQTGKGEEDSKHRRSTTRPQKILTKPERDRVDIPKHKISSNRQNQHETVQTSH